MAIQVLEKGKKYKIIVPVSYEGNKRKTHCEVFYGNKKDAIIKESELKKQVKMGNFMCNDKITVEELIKEWLKIKKDLVELKTYVTYEKYANNIIKIIGNKKLKDVTVNVLQNFYYELRTKNSFSEKTILHHYNILANVFCLAEKWELIVKNPHKYIDRPKVHKKEMVCYSQEETKKLLRVLRNESLKAQAIITLAIDTGCRRGELTGLTWEDINLDTGEIVINKTTQYVSGVGIYEKSTKTNSK